MPDFSYNSKFNKYANFSSIKFGADAPLLETELNEMQDIQRERLRSFLKVHVGDGLYGVGTINYSDGIFTIENELALVNGNLITISRLEIEAVEGDSIYLQVKEKEVAYTDVLKKYGNEQETSTVPNQMYDERVNQETSRRVVETYNLSLTTDDEDSYYLKLGTITGGVFVNEVKSIKTGSLSETERAYWNGKADVSYVDEQITLVTETGIPKLNVYEYKFPNLPAGTTEIEIPLETFDERTDTVKLYINSVYRDSDFYTISDKKIILNEALSNVSKVTIEVWKNVPIGEDGSVSGTVIAIDTLPQNRVQGLTTHLADGTQHAKTARFVIGTSMAGWTEKDCNYLCDGTNDQEEINQAIQDLPVSGGEIIILDGTYNITAKINVNKDNVSIKGNGNATVLKRMWDSSSLEGIITLTSVEGCRIQNLQFDGNRANYSSSYNSGIYLNSSSNITITGNTCNNNINGIYLDASSNNTITGNTCNNNNDGIYLDASSNNTITGNTCNNNNIGIRLYSSSNITITGNTCNSNTDIGIYLNSSSNKNTITGNTCNNNSNYGIYLNSSSNNTITSNTCNNNTHSGIYLYSSSNENTITGNTCNNNTNNGINLYSSNNNTITSNACNNNTNNGVYLYSSSNNTITSNACNNNTHSGIHLNSSSNENAITGNACNNNNYGINLYLSSNENTVTGNTCNNNTSNGIHLNSTNNNTITGNTCIRGTGQTSDYTSNQYTILLYGSSNNYNLISSNNCMGKAVVVQGGTGNSAWGNKFDNTDDLP